MTAPLESHAHSTAKRLLVEWLRAAAEEAGYDNLAVFPSDPGMPRWPATAICWVVNRLTPTWGIWSEYPILADDTGLDPVWDEIDRRWNARPPTYQEVIDRGDRPMCVLDVAIQHKGAIHYAIEVVHKHRCDPRKIGFLRPRLTLIEIPAYWVLGQVDRPNGIPAEFFL